MKIINHTFFLALYVTTPLEVIPFLKLPNFYNLSLIKNISKIKIGVSHMCYVYNILTRLYLALSYKIFNLKPFGIKISKKIFVKSLGNSLRI